MLKSIIIGLTIGLTLILGGCSKSSESTEEGYLVLESPNPSVASNNVTELFWYGCPHCLNVEPLADKIKALAENKDIVFQQVHFPSTSGVWGYDFKVYAAFKQLGLESTVGKEYMRSVQGSKPMNRKEIASFLESHGVDPNNFAALMQNEEKDRILQEATLFVSEQVKGTPAFIVGGKFLITEKDPEKILKLIEDLASR